MMDMMAWQGMDPTMVESRLLLLNFLIPIVYK